MHYNFSFLTNILHFNKQHKAITVCVVVCTSNGHFTKEAESVIISNSSKPV